jgi:hypothetical protein
VNGHGPRCGGPGTQLRCRQEQKKKGNNSKINLNTTNFGQIKKKEKKIQPIFVSDSGSRLTSG